MKNLLIKCPIVSLIEPPFNISLIFFCLATENLVERRGNRGWLIRMSHTLWFSHCHCCTSRPWRLPHFSFASYNIFILLMFHSNTFEAQLQIDMHPAHLGAYLSDTYTHLHHHYLRLSNVYHESPLCHVIEHESFKYQRFPLFLLYVCHAPPIVSLLSLWEALSNTFWCCYVGRYALNETWITWCLHFSSTTHRNYKLFHFCSPQLVNNTSKLDFALAWQNHIH